MLSYPTLDFSLLALACSGLILLRLRKPFKIIWLLAFMSIYHIRVESMRVDCPNPFTYHNLQGCKERGLKCAEQLKIMEDEFHGWDKPVDEEGYMADCSGDDCPSGEANLSAWLGARGGRLVV